MIRKELYINNILVDLPPNFSIGLNFECSEVNDLNSVASNYSSTISLPITSTNKKAIEFMCYPVSDSLLPYDFIDARYYISGLPIFEDGKAVIAEITDKSININIFWNSFAKLAELENLLLTDLNISDTLINNYRTTLYDGIYLQQLFADFGNTYSYTGISWENTLINCARFFPSFKAKAIFDLILGGASSYVMQSEVANHLNSIRFVTGTRNGNSSTTLYTRIKLAANLSGLSNLVPLGSAWYNLDFFDYARIIENPYSLIKSFDFEGGGVSGVPANAKFMAAPAKGTYRVYGSIAVNPAAFPNSSKYVHPVIRVYSVAEGWEPVDESEAPPEVELISIDLGELTAPFSGYPPSASFDETIELSGFNQTLRVVISTSTNIDVAQTERPHLGDYSGVFGVKLTEIKIEYTDPNNYSGFLMGYPAKENLPEMTQKDFIKSIMQIYSLMLTIKNNKPYFFRFEDVIENISIAKDWTQKLIIKNDALIPEKSTFDLGVAKTNYFKYAKDELVNELTGRGTIASEYSIVKEKTIVQQAKFAASQDVVIASRGKAISGIYMKQHEQKDGKTNYSGKAKLRIGFLNTISSDIEFDHFNVYNEDSFSESITGAKSIKFLGNSPGSGLDYSFDLINTFMSGYASVIEHGRKLTLTFRLNSIDLHEFDFTVPVWLSQFNRYFFVKKINNWDDGIDCQVELIQLP